MELRFRQFTLMLLRYAVVLLPDSFKAILRPVYRCVMRIALVRLWIWGETSRDRCHKYWIDPTDEGNKPIWYLRNISRSKFMLAFINKYANKEDKILEIGCSVGRNLQVLYESGYRNLSGIEINSEAVEIMKSRFTDMATSTELYNDAVENVIKEMPDNKYDIVFTMCVLEHIHEDSNWIFGEMARITRKALITLEDEDAVSWRTFARNYQKVFEGVGMKQDIRICLV